MSDKNLDRAWTIGKRSIRIAGSFVPLAGAGTVVATNVRGLGFGYAPVNGLMALKAQPGNNPTPLTVPGILRTGVGVYTIILENPWLGCDSFTVSLGVPVAGVQLWAWPVEPITGMATAGTGPTFTILLANNAGTPTEGAVTQRVHFDIIVRDSTVSFNKP